VDEAPQAILQPEGIEVEQQGDLAGAHAEVGQRLRLMRRKQAVNSLDFHDQLSGNEQVSPKPRFKAYAAVDHRDGHLTPEGDACLLQLEGKTGFIHRFQQPGPECAVHIDGKPYHTLAQPLLHQHRPCLSQPSAVVCVNC
jgi:hypothetical protein